MSTKQVLCAAMIILAITIVCFFCAQRLGDSKPNMAGEEQVSVFLDGRRYNEVALMIVEFFPEVQMRKSEYREESAVLKTQTSDPSLFQQQVVLIDWAVNHGQTVTPEMLEEPLHSLVARLRLITVEALNMDKASSWPEILLEQQRQSKLFELLHGHGFQTPWDTLGRFTALGYLEGFLQYRAIVELVKEEVPETSKIVCLLLECLQSRRLAARLADLPSVKVEAVPGKVAVVVAGYDQEEVERDVLRTISIFWAHMIGEKLEERDLDDPENHLCQRVRRFAALQMGVAEASSWSEVIQALQKARSAGKQTADIFVPEWMPEQSGMFVRQALINHFWTQEEGELLAAML